jgi:hypothetical protein
MGRSFESVRMGVKEVSARWAKAGRALKKDDQIYASKLSDMAKKHSSEAFYAMDDPLEAAVFSVLVEMLKEMEEMEKNNGRRTMTATQTDSTPQELQTAKMGR